MGIKHPIGDGSSFRSRPRFSGRPFLAIAVIATLAIAALFAAAPAQAQDQSAEPLWSADMLVAEITSVSIGADGGDHFSNIGGTGNLQIRSLWSYTPSRDLRLAFEEAVPGADDLTLQVGGLTLEFPAESSGHSSFKWKGVEVDWEDGQTISVRIMPTPAPGEPPLNSPATGVPTISGTAKVWETLTVHTDGIADFDGIDISTFSYQWLADDADISGATGSSYTLASADAGKTIKVRVNFSDDAGNDETRISNPTEEIGPPDYHGDSMATATELELDTPIDGVTHGPDDVDFFKIVLTEPTHIFARIYGPDHFTSTHNYAAFLDANGDEAGVKRAGGRPGAGTYFVKVQRFDAYRDLEVGLEHYTLRVLVIPEHGDTIETATQLNQTSAQLDLRDPHRLSGPLNEWSEHNPLSQIAYLHSGSDQDFFKLELPTTTMVRIVVGGPTQLLSYRTSSGRAGPAIEAINVHLFDSDGNAVESVEDGFPTGEEGRLHHLDAGTHYLRFSPYSDEFGGPYLGWYYLQLFPVDAGGNARGGICNRTGQVRTTILGRLPDFSIAECELVTQDHLDLIAGTLYLQDGSISHLKAEDFEGLPLLQSVLLAHNDLTSLPDGAFDDLSNLEVLSLAHNDLESLPDGVFDSLSGLKVLHLGHNDLTSLPEGIFDNLSELEVLSLVSNDLSDLPDGVFNSLTSLRKLYLGGNSLSALPDGALEDPSSLEVLSFSGEPPSPVQRPLRNNVPSDLPVINGKTIVNRTLSAITTGMIDPDCDDPRLRIVEFSYQWILVDGTTETEIEGATGATYRPTQVDVGKSLKVRVH